MAERSAVKVVTALVLGAVMLIVGCVLLVAVLDPNARACPVGKQLIIVSTGKVTVLNCV